MSSKKYYKDINLIRIICTVAILFYHLGVIKGGYLAVCTFFVLSGYLSCITSFDKEKFSLLSYYKNRLKKVYLPLIIVVFISIGAISFFNNIYWFNLKPETTSILLGYNNFWQRSANLDYFARHVDSPFMHLWYISILMQFEILFPLLFKILKKIGDKFKSIPCIILFGLFVLSSIYFYKINLIKGINYAYYDTFGRSFSLFLGMFIGFVSHYYKTLIIKNKIFNRIIFYLYLILLCASFILIPSSSSYYSIAIILVSIVSARLIEYGSLNVTSKQFLNMTYEIYLFQYPVIYIFEYINVPYKIYIIIGIVFALSYLLHYILYGKKFKAVKIILTLFLICFSLYGVNRYCVSKDHTKEMNDLKDQLANNEKMIDENNKKYLENLKQEEENWIKELEKFDNYEEKLNDVVKNLPIVGIGDSVMLGAVNNLYNIFPNGYFDAKISRQPWAAIDIIEELKSNNKLGYPVVIHLGTNGDCSVSCKDQIMNAIGDKKVYLINTTNSDSVNNNLKAYVQKHDNIYLIDWKNISLNHREYFYADGIHLTPAGRKAYADAIYNAIYNNYLNDYKIQREELIKGFEEKQLNKISFYGNDILLNAFDFIKKDFNDSNFTINDYDNIVSNLKENKLTKKLVFIFSDLSEEKYNELLNICGDNKVYLININGKFEGENVINFDVKKEYLMPDGKHLNNKGNSKLAEIVKKNIVDK